MIELAPNAKWLCLSPDPNATKASTRVSGRGEILKICKPWFHLINKTFLCEQAPCSCLLYPKQQQQRQEEPKILLLELDPPGPVSGRYRPS
ncbi:hypothetical protein PanWU01x14_149680 [Parasponia andersonii]|uniref:Uncharacterized protein n=1 Tax=Parasponia andersonii TaxID=3476 RepID=A0A2P5CIH1_PARAD|nr:hypothetical protein PanWU01x14_149680 [Parasponia andersonii]